MLGGGMAESWADLHFEDVFALPPRGLALAGDFELLGRAGEELLQGASHVRSEGSFSAAHAAHHTAHAVHAHAPHAHAAHGAAHEHGAAPAGETGREGEAAAHVVIVESTTAE